MVDITELNLYKDSARDKIADYSKQITKLKRKIEDIEEKNEHGLLSNISSTVKKQRDKRLEKYNKKLNILELKSETYKFDNIKQPEEEPSTDTVSYLQYHNRLIDNDIKKIQIKKDESVLTVSKFIYSKSIKKLKKQQHKNDLKIRVLQRKEEDIQSKKLDEHISEQKFKESKQANEKSKENKSKIIKPSTLASKNNNVQSGSSDIDTVSNIDYSTLNPKNLGELSKLVSINTKIYDTLEKISDNQIDEQDTSIKASEIEKVEPTLVSQKDEEPVKKEDSLLSKLLGFASLLFGMGISAPKMLFKYMLKSVKSSLKFFLKPFLTPINLAINGIYKLVKPLVKLVAKISKTVFNSTVKIGTKALAKTSEKLGTKVLAKTSEKSASKFAKVAKSSSIFGWLGKKVSGAVDFAKKKGLGFAKKLVLPFIEKIIGKKGLKILLKVLSKLPGVSILTGLGFAAYDIAKGDYAHAAVDVLSGIVGSIPWVGPVLGIATDYVGGLVIDKYSKSKAQSKTNIKTKKGSTKGSTKSSKNSSFVFNSMVKGEISSLKQDPSFLPKEIKYYNNKNNDNVPVITINKESYTDERGKQIKIDDIYKLRRAYVKYLVASSQNVDSKQYKRQILSIINNKVYTGNVKTSDNNQLNNKYVSSVSSHDKQVSTVDTGITEVPNLVFANNQVQIGSNIYPSNRVIEQDYNNYKLDKNTDSTERILEDIKILKESAHKKDNSESKIKTLSSIFNNNQSVLNASNKGLRHSQNNQSNEQTRTTNTNNTNHINIVQPSQKEGARLIDMYQ